MAENRDFWSRRREAVAAEQVAQDTAVEQAEIATKAAALEARSDEDILQELDLPQPEDLDTTEAVQAFLKSDLPQRLKTRALRRLWRLNPIFGRLDGLVDYGEDFTDSATVIENMQTVYQVGKGMFDKIEELARQKAEAEAKAAAEKMEDAEPEEEPAPLETLPEEPPTTMTFENTEAEELDPMPQTPRRMRFSFEASA